VSGTGHAIFVAVELVLLVLFAALALWFHAHQGPVVGDVGTELDVQHALLPHPALAGPIEAVSTLNFPVPSIVTLVVIAAIFLLLRRWLDVIVVPIAAGAESLATYVIGNWVRRPRPAGHGIRVLQHISSSFSFPSGHITYAVAVFGLFLFLTFQVRRAFHPALVWAIRLVLVVLILLMPVSRLLEGEHWPSDVLAGAIEGLFWLVLFAHLYLWARQRWPHLLARDER
jgi:undecaprenyl-diphosphatase